MAESLPLFMEWTVIIFFCDLSLGGYLLCAGRGFKLQKPAGTKLQICEVRKYCSFKISILS